MILPILKQLNAETVSTERKEVLNKLADAINQSYAQCGSVKLNFICTHNSRRSIFSQVWASVISEYLQLPSIEVYSGGTEVTKVFPQVIKTLKEQGVTIFSEDKSENPKFQFKSPQHKKEVLLFSKLYNDEANPSENFIAVMTCNSADADCPFIPGAFKRISTPFVDPKFSDGSDKMDKIYEQTSVEIATELMYVLNKVKVK